MNVVFKNMEPSDFARDLVMEKASGIISKFPELKSSKITVTLEMENSPYQAGPDVFNTQFHIQVPNSTKPILLKKSQETLYLSIAEASEALFQVLSKAHEKKAKGRKGLSRELKYA